MAEDCVHGMNPEWCAVCHKTDHSEVSTPGNYGYFEAGRSRVCSTRSPTSLGSFESPSALEAASLRTSSTRSPRGLAFRMAQCPRSVRRWRARRAAPGLWRYLGRAEMVT